MAAATPQDLPDRLSFRSGIATHGAEPMATHCRESGVPLTNTPGKVEKDFASTSLRNKFHARRRERGSQLYDLLMHDLFGPESESRPVDAVMDEVTGMLYAWREEDLKEREGRPSWNAPQKLEGGQ